MLNSSVTIFRKWRNLKISELIRKSGLNHQSYYNAINAKPLSYNTIKSLDQALQLDGFLFITHLFDRLYNLGVRLNPETFYYPDRFKQIATVFLDSHPIFEKHLNIIDKNLTFNKI